MFVVLLKFSTNRALAAQHMDGHKAWLQRGFAEGAFLLSGSLQPGLGGIVVAAPGPRAALEARIAADPFVEHGVVDAEVMEVAPSMLDERLAFLRG